MNNKAISLLFFITILVQSFYPQQRGLKRYANGALKKYTLDTYSISERSRDLSILRELDEFRYLILNYVLQKSLSKKQGFSSDVEIAIQQINLFWNKILSLTEFQSGVNKKVYYFLDVLKKYLNQIRLFCDSSSRKKISNDLLIKLSSNLTESMMNKFRNTENKF